MSGTTLTTLRVLSRHLSRPLSTLRPSQALERDLDLTALEVVLVALEVETVADLEIDLDGLEGVETVGDLCRFLTQRVSIARQEESRVA